MCDTFDLDGDFPKVWRETPRLARKARRCDSCRAPINPGDAYLEHFSVTDDPLTEAMCFACWWDRAQFAEEHRQSFNPSSFRDLLSECVTWDEKSAARWTPALEALDARMRAARA